MPNYVYTLGLVILGATSAAFADTPLASKDIPFTAIPYMVDTSDGPRGIQTGVNRCNSTTEGPNSICQTIFVNSADDWCIWGARLPNSTVADHEGDLVGYCTKRGHGTRILSAGTIKGMTFIQTPSYVQVTGRLDQTGINLSPSDTGGEEDPHGADGRGNPLGSLMYSNAFTPNNSTFTQCKEWHNFLGGGAFCIKCCDPKGPNAARLCEHIYDRIGCAYNAPADYKEGVFESCKGEDQDPPGVFTGSDGRVSTYTQPPESLGPISTMPYSPRLPASSQCVSFQSSQLFAGAPGASTSTTASPTTAAGSKVTGSASRTDSASTPSNTASKQASGALSVGPHVGGLLAFVMLAAVMA